MCHVRWVSLLQALGCPEAPGCVTYSSGEELEYPPLLYVPRINGMGLIVFDPHLEFMQVRSYRGVQERVLIVGLRDGRWLRCLQCSRARA